MESINDITVETDNGFKQKTVQEKITINDIIFYLTENEIEIKNKFITGQVYQKNKKLKLLDTFFKQIEDQIKKMESKNNKDSDNTFFNLNKRIVLTNLSNIKEILNLYDIDEETILYFTLGTLIQYIHDKQNR